MNRALVKVQVKPPKELACLFADPPLVGNESREEYDRLLSALAADVKPADAISWVYLADFVNLTWEIKRERWLKQLAIRSAEIGEVQQLLMSAVEDPDIKEGALVAARWAAHPKGRAKIIKELDEMGYTLEKTIGNAFRVSNERVNPIDQRIESFETRRSAILREFHRHNESKARRLENASSKIIDGEFTEAAE